MKQTGWVEFKPAQQSREEIARGGAIVGKALEV